MSATNVTDKTKRKRHLAATFGRIVGRHFFSFDRRPAAQALQKSVMLIRLIRANGVLRQVADKTCCRRWHVSATVNKCEQAYT